MPPSRSTLMLHLFSQFLSQEYDCGFFSWLIDDSYVECSSCEKLAHRLDELEKENTTLVVKLDKAKAKKCLAEKSIEKQKHFTVVVLMLFLITCVIYKCMN